MEVCEWLVGCGCDIHHLNKWMCGAIHFASLAGELGSLKWLHSIHISMDTPNNQGHNALHKVRRSAFLEGSQLHATRPRMVVTERCVSGFKRKWD